MHHFSGLGPLTRHVAVLVPPKSCVGPWGGVFFSADHPSPSSSSHTFSLDLQCLGLVFKDKDHVGSIMQDAKVNNKDNGCDIATFSCALFTAC